MNDQQKDPWPQSRGEELRYTFEMFEQIWAILCDHHPGRRERTAGVVGEIRNHLLRPANGPRSGRPALKLISGKRSAA